jgi:site-specific DNA-methyltransferase (adenine-specific)
VTPYYAHGGITIYHGDCREIAPALGRDFAVVSDPPYGMKWDTDSRRFSGGRRDVRRGDGIAPRPIVGDTETFDPTPWLQYPHATLWGANHYAAALPVGTWLVWVKKHEHLYGTFLSDAELAWEKGGHGVYCHSIPFPPPTRAADAGMYGAHPTQKPVRLMAWCIARAGTTAPVLDPFMGSGTTLVAAKQSGRQAIGIEMEERYCEVAAKRLEQEVLDFGGAA